MLESQPLRSTFFALLAAGLLALSGCAREIGRDFDPDRADGLVVGTSTLADASAVLGEPFRTYRFIGGKIAKWWYLRDTSGMTETVLLEIRFGADGRMLGIIREIEERAPEAGNDSIRHRPHSALGACRSPDSGPQQQAAALPESDPGHVAQTFVSGAADRMADGGKGVIRHAQHAAHHLGRTDEPGGHHAEGGNALAFGCH